MHVNQDTREFETAKRDLDSKFLQQWLLMTTVPILTTVTLAMVMPFVREVYPDAWPWAGTDTLLVSGLYLVVILFAWHVITQQRRIMKLRDALYEARTDVHEARKRHRNRMMAICALNGAVGDESDPRSVFETLTRMCKDVFESDRSSLMTLDHKAQRLVVQAAFGHENTARVIGASRELGEGIAGWVALHREPLLLGKEFDQSRFHGRLPDVGAIRSAMIVPLVVREQVVGVLSVANVQCDVEYDTDDLTTLQVFAETAEFCIRHAENADWMRSLIRHFQESRTRETQDVESSINSSRAANGKKRAKTVEITPLEVGDGGALRVTQVGIRGGDALEN